MKKIILLLLFISGLGLIAQAQDEAQTINKARKEYEKGNYQQAFLDYIAVLGKNPRSKEAIMGLGETLLSMGDTTEAVNYYNHAISLFPQDFQVYKKLGVFFINAGKEKKALQIFKQAYKQLPDNPKAMAWLGVAYLIYGNADSANYFFDKAIAHDPNSIDIYTTIAQGYFALENYDKAIEYMDKAIAKDPLNDSLFFQKSQIETEAQKYGQALADINQAIKLNPDSRDYYLQKLNIYFSAQNYPQAAKFAKSIFGTTRDSALLYMEVYALWLNQEPTDTVMTYLDKALDKTPSASLWYFKGMVLNTQKKYKEAAQAFKKAMDKQPWKINYTREYIGNTLIANSKDLDNNLYFKNFNQSSLKQIKKLLRSKRSKYYYPRIVEKISSNPLQAGLEDYLFLYLGKAFDHDYSPVDRELDYNILDSLLIKGKYNQVITKAAEAIKRDPGNMAVYYILTMTYYHLGQLEEFRNNYARYMGLAMAALATGQGDNKKDAIISASPMDEIMALNFLSYDQLVNRDQVEDKKHAYNIYQIAQNGKIKTYYFNIDLYWKKLKK